MSKSIEDLEPWQTTTGLKIFILLRFAWRIFLWGTITLIVGSYVAYGIIKNFSALVTQ